jgi:hypothetical protein
LVPVKVGAFNVTRYEFKLYKSAVGCFIPHHFG